MIEWVFGGVFTENGGISASAARKSPFNARSNAFYLAIGISSGFFTDHSSIAFCASSKSTRAHEIPCFRIIDGNVPDSPRIIHHIYRQPMYMRMVIPFDKLTRRINFDGALQFTRGKSSSPRCR